MAQPRTHDIQRDSTSNEPVPGRAMAQRMSASPPLPGPRRFLIQTRPLDPIADVPERRPHRKRDHLVPRRPVRRPVRKQAHQLPVQPHGTSTPALRLPDQQSSRIPRVVEVAPFQFERFGNPKTTAPHDERRGPSLVPVVGRQSVQKALDLSCLPIMRYFHAWQNTPVRTLPKAPRVTSSAPNNGDRRRAEGGRL